MYWQFPSSDMPPPRWDREVLCRELPPFLPDPRPAATSSVREYCRWYGLDLEHCLPVEHCLGYLSCGDHRIALHRYRQSGVSRGTVFVLHGYFDHAGLYSRLFEHLLRQGYDVISWDLPGHGLSSGEPASINSFDDYQVVLRGAMEQLGTGLRGPWFAIGQSTGGAILIDHLLRHQPQQDRPAFQQVVLLAPLVRPAGWPLGRLLHRLVAPHRSTWKRSFSRNSGDERFLRFLQQEDPLQSRALSIHWVTAMAAWIRQIRTAQPAPGAAVTVIQGKQDRTVDWRFNLRVLREKFPRCQICLLPQGKHHLVNEVQPLLNQLFLLIDGALSGADLPSHAPTGPGHQGERE